MPYYSLSEEFKILPCVSLMTLNACGIKVCRANYKSDLHVILSINFSSSFKELFDVLANTDHFLMIFNSKSNKLPDNI